MITTTIVTVSFSFIVAALLACVAAGTTAPMA